MIINIQKMIIFSKGRPFKMEIEFYPIQLYMYFFTQQLMLIKINMLFYLAQNIREK